MESLHAPDDLRGIEVSAQLKESSAPELRQAGDPSASPLALLLGIFGDVRDAEVVTTLLLLSNISVMLAGYYICKTVREPLILTGGGAEMKSYAAAGQALLLMGFVPAYGWFASRVDRIRLAAILVWFGTSSLGLGHRGSQ